MLGPLGQRLAKFSAQLYNLFEMMINSKILENNHQRPFRGSFYVWKWRAWTSYKNFIYQKPVYLQELKLNPFPYLSSVYIFQIIEIFPSLFCHCLFIGLIRNPLDLSCTRPGREYCSRHLTDAVSSGWTQIFWWPTRGWVLLQLCPSMMSSVWQSSPFPLLSYSNLLLCQYTAIPCAPGHITIFHVLPFWRREHWMAWGQAANLICLKGSDVQKKKT